jgi:alkylation response protein AidB-like acyl-CoA dehydrogenase
MMALARQGRSAAPVPIQDPVVRQQIAEVYIDLEIMRLNGLRSLSTLLAGRTPGPETSIDKLHWGATDNKLHRLALGLLGPWGQLGEHAPNRPGSGRLQYGFLRALSSTIHGGTAQIQRNIIAERLLGMPRGR